MTSRHARVVVTTSPDRAPPPRRGRSAGRPEGSRRRPATRDRTSGDRGRALRGRLAHALLAAAAALALASTGARAFSRTTPEVGHPDGGVEPEASSDAGVAGRPAQLVYPTDRTHSPLTEEVAVRLRTVARRAPWRRGDVFVKVGDSNTVNPGHLECLASGPTDLLEDAALEGALRHFRAGRVDGGTPFERASLAAAVGWTADDALAGVPSPLQQELDAAQPRFASVMFGTNDVGAADPHAFGRHLFTLVDTLTRQGVVPLLSTVPPRSDDAAADAWVTRYNLVVRGVAQARRVPLVDLHRELLALPGYGLGPDGIHLSTGPGGRGGALADASGHGVRNRLTLAALARAWDAVEGRAVPDEAAPRRLGSGRPGDEVVVDTLPFVDVRDTRVDGEARLARYPGCGTGIHEGGREVLYRLELPAATTVRVFVVAVGAADVDVHLLSAPDSGEACVERGDRGFVRALPAGTWWLSVDTYQAPAGPRAGEYLLGVLAE